MVACSDLHFCFFTYLEYTKHLSVACMGFEKECIHMLRDIFKSSFNLITTSNCLKF